MSRGGLAQFKGGAIAFVQTTQTHDAALGRVMPVHTTVAGYARALAGDGEHYDTLSLAHEKATTLEFFPTVPGEEPALGARATWAGVPQTVRLVQPYEPAGVTISARVILER